MELESQGKKVVGSIPASGRVRMFFSFFSNTLSPFLVFILHQLLLCFTILHLARHILWLVFCLMRTVIP